MPRHDPSVVGRGYGTIGERRRAGVYDYDQLHGLIRGGWARQRSEVERNGSVEDEGWLEVLDLERALRYMASPAIRHRRQIADARDASLAAILISAQLFLDFQPHDLRFALNKGRGFDTEKLTRKGAAWMAEFLNGCTVEDADKAFRKQA